MVRSAFPLGNHCLEPAGQLLILANKLSAIYYLHSNEITLGLEAGNEIQVGKSIAALQSITRMVIYGIKHAYTGVPMDLDCIAFWAHKTVYHAALCHIRYGARNHEWEVDLEECKAYLRYFAPRFKLHS